MTADKKERPSKAAFGPYISGCTPTLESYNPCPPSPPELVEARHRAREIMYRYNNSSPTCDGRERREMLAELFCVPVESIPGVYIEPPLYVDFGSNIKVASDFYAKYNTTRLRDCHNRETGVVRTQRVALPATHGISAKERQTRLERASEITIGDDCWIGGGASSRALANIQAGVTLGQGCTVAAGAVVTRSFPDWSVVVGNPARLIKVVPEEERGPGWAPFKAIAN
ncbi:trimeric LpxA-like protein [Hymenopellis radicata]|nr:trimeric LpxA-like protein [Hymenopellis radicata]